MHNTGKVLILLGLIAVIAGIVVYFWGDKFSWLGHLPGDICIEKENFRFYFPITTMIIVSVVLSIIVRIIQKLF
ncbi:DUF2905 domain-containing protein [Parabacteroides sp. FAFU027]|uniref:DUF2905 domain-containing protein n=1 Tax=Parabacteroides sp. FAFU027 TaxID=2922715 RepID=UPI001FAF6EB2|nr:DUF2905 domain-containing protein [Parabacteroides sp. FAFU027]